MELANLLIAFMPAALVLMAYMVGKELGRQSALNAQVKVSSPRHRHQIECSLGLLPFFYEDILSRLEAAEDALANGAACLAKIDGAMTNPNESRNTNTNCGHIKPK